MKHIARLCLFLGLATLSFMTESRAWDVNTSLDPFGVYGNCAGPEKGLFVSKAGQVIQALGKAGKPATLKDVLAIKVLACKTYTGGGPALIVSCPSGQPYSYCVRNNNDGNGHDVLLGILTRNRVTDPNANYSGCTVGGIPQSKLALYIAAGGDPLMINGIVTLTCSASTGAPVNPTQVTCPAGSPFQYCVQTPNDGHGNAVLLGAIGANGASDPYALYGNCTSNGRGQPGFRAKASILTDLGISLDAVRTVDILGCVNPDGNPPPLAVVSCSIFSDPQGKYYDQCAWGQDAKRNTVFLGINNGGVGKKVIRTPRWFDPAEALTAVNDTGLQCVIGRFIERMSFKEGPKKPPS